MHDINKNSNENSCRILTDKLHSFNIKSVMETMEPFNIYECFDQNGDPIKYICQGHIDSTQFRDKCYEEYFVKPMVVQHRWRRTRKFVERQPDKKYARSYTRSERCSEFDNNATPVTVGLLQNLENMQE